MSPSVAEDEIVLRLDSWYDDRAIGIAVTAAYSAELAEALRVEGFDPDEGSDGARTSVTDVLVAAIENPAAWTALAGCILAFIRRHRGKRVSLQLDSQSVEFKDYSAKDVARVVEALRVAHEARQATWTRLGLEPTAAEQIGPASDA
jgi:hypothetical protein